MTLGVKTELTTVDGVKAYWLTPDRIAPENRNRLLVHVHSGCYVSGPAESGTVLFPYLLVAFGFLVGLPIARAVRRPGPKEVQAAVKRCVLGLVALDAVLATAFLGAPGLLILFLLPPALLLGKWVYST